MTTSTLVREREILEVALEKLGVLYL